MDELADMEKRLNLQQLCCFLSSGMELTSPEEGTRQERVRRREAVLLGALEREAPDPAGRERLCERVMDYAGACADVCLEEGLRAGFRLAVRLLEGA